MHRAAFLDRDGVINVDRGYVWRIDDFEFTPTAIDAVRMLNEAGYRTIVVTNQSGVARGYFGLADVERLHEHIRAEMAQSHATIDAFYFCPYHPDGSVARFAHDHPNRKPGSGMLLQAMKDWSIDRMGSFLIGDKQSDLAAAQAAGIEGILVPKDCRDLAAVVRMRLDL